MINVEKIKEVKENLGNASLVVASKYYTVDEIKTFLSYDIHNFGENRVDSFLEKYEALKEENITWHFIGHLQKNKASKVINKIEYLHSLDSLELARLIDKKRDTPLKCFVEVKLVNSDTKSGVEESKLEKFLDELKKFKNIEVIGLMVMTNKEDSIADKIDVFFKAIKLCEIYGLKHLSAGMSSDYLYALNSGATWVRLGKIFME